MPRKKTRSPSTPDRATRYAQDVVAGRVVAGPSVRAACARHLRDLESGLARGLTWDLSLACRAIGFIEEVCNLNGGDFEGVPFLLADWQAFIVGSLFGWTRVETGYRRFRMSYIEIGKGNGKSPLAAAIGLYGMVADKESRAEIYAAATKKDQAQILFRDAVAMVEMSPGLSGRLTKSGKNPVWQLTDLTSGSWFKPISSDDGQSGPRPHVCLIDEVHEHKNADVIDMLRAGFKGRNQPLLFEITNSGHDKTSVCYQHHEYSKRVVTGQVPETDCDEWFAYVCDLDEGDDPLKDEACWAKANPNLGVSIKLPYLRGLVAEARGMPAKESIVKRLNFCQWVDAANPWIGYDAWAACEVPYEDFAIPDGVPVAALDLSGAKDLSALSLVWPGDITYALVEFWTPKDTMKDREKLDRVPYGVWVNQGHLTATPGRSVDYSFIAQRIADWQQSHGLAQVAFDPYRILYLERELERLGVEIELVPHGQGYYKSVESGLWMPRSVELLEDHVAKQKLHVRKSPVLTWNSASAVLEADPKNNRIFTKRKSTGRIDGIVTLAMGLGLADIGPKSETPGMAVF